MQLVIYVFTFVYGICVGSFLNVVIYRLPRKIDMVHGRSYCPSCGHKLGALDLFPLFSYLFLGRKCRYCREEISPQYFIVEFITGLLYVAVVYAYGLSLYSLCYLVIISLLLPAVRIDLLHSIVPNRLVYPIFIFSVVLGVFVQGRSLFDCAVSAVVFSLIYIVPSIVLAILKRRPFGMGDIKLSIALGVGLELAYFYDYFYLTLAVLFGTILPSIIADKIDVKKPFPFSLVIGLTYTLLIICIRYL